MDRHPSESQVCVVLVTFNRARLLEKVLASLRLQSQKIGKIYIIDNCSSDGTRDVVQSFIDDNGAAALVSYELMNENIGGAGGFSHGMSIAHQDGWEWLWLIDDDVVPDPRCLETLLSWKDVSRCLHPTAIEANGMDYEWARISPYGSLYQFKYPSEVYSNTRWQYSNMACFEGMLIHREIVDKVGFPDARFFISWDDTSYGLAVSLHENILAVRDAKIARLLPRAPWAGRSLYYGVRNRFLAINKIRELGFQRGVEHWLLDQIQLLRMLRAHILRPSDLRLIALGLWDGVRGHFGIAKRKF